MTRAAAILVVLIGLAASGAVANTGAVCGQQRLRVSELICPGDPERPETTSPPGRSCRPWNMDFLRKLYLFGDAEQWARAQKVVDDIWAGRNGWCPRFCQHCARCWPATREHRGTGTLLAIWWPNDLEAGGGLLYTLAVVAHQAGRKSCPGSASRPQNQQQRYRRSQCAACPVIAANPRDTSRLLRFLVDAPNTDPEIGQNSPRARACARQGTLGSDIA
jgi:hypothetical protein